MISVVIPTLNAAKRLPDCLNALIEPAVDGLVKEVFVVDGGSSDDSANIAEAAGATLLTAPPGRGGQLKAGAENARGKWLLFLHGDTVLEEGWANEVADFINSENNSAGVFSLAFDQSDWRGKMVAAGAMARTRIFRAPYGDQALLILRKTYDEIGGFSAAPLFEDVEIIDRLIGKKGADALHIFSSRAVTSCERYERDGYLRRVIRNFVLLMRYRLGAAPDKLAKAYR